jgi:hypothetical protein
VNRVWGLLTQRKNHTDGVRRIRGDGTKYTTSGGASLTDLRPTSGQVSSIQGLGLMGLQQGGGSTVMCPNRPPIIKV